MIKQSKRLTTADLFTRFPRIPPLLLRVLEAIPLDSTEAAHESARFAVLLFLSSMLPTRQHPAAVEASCEALLPLLERNNQSSSWSVRSMSAQATSALVSTQSLSANFSRLVAALETQGPRLPSNQLHGILLRLESYLGTVDFFGLSSLSEEESVALATHAATLLRLVWLLRAAPPCVHVYLAMATSLFGRFPSPFVPSHWSSPHCLARSRLLAPLPRPF